MKKLTVKEYAQHLGVSESKLRRMTDRGQVKVTLTKGGHRRYVIDTPIQSKPKSSKGMNSKQYAAYLGISISTLRNRLADGQIVATNVTQGGHRRYSAFANNKDLYGRLSLLATLFKDEAKKYPVDDVADILRTLADCIEQGNQIEVSIFNKLRGNK